MKSVQISSTTEVWNNSPLQRTDLGTSDTWGCSVPASLARLCWLFLKRGTWSNGKSQRYAVKTKQWHLALLAHRLALIPLPWVPLQKSLGKTLSSVGNYVWKNKEIAKHLKKRKLKWRAHCKVSTTLNCIKVRQIYGWRGQRPCPWRAAASGLLAVILCTESSFQHRALKSKIASRDVFFHITLMSQWHQTDTK